MNVLKMEKKLAVISALVEGNSIRSTERMTGVHRDTIMRLLLAIGEKCNHLLDTTIRNLNCRLVQTDEIWCYVGKKQRRIADGDSVEFGDQYVFVALDAESKLVPCFRVGKRDGATALEFMADLEKRLANRVQLSTDAFRPYANVVDEVFGTEVDYAQITKIYKESAIPEGRYSPPTIVGIAQTRLMGNPKPEYISTSYVERQNLTIRMAIRRFTRLTNAFSKKLENLKAAVALHFAHYNFVRIHKTLRVTPAIAAGVTGRLWELAELL